VYIRVHCSTLGTMKTQKWNACFGEDELIIIIIIIIIIILAHQHKACRQLKIKQEMTAVGD